MWGLLRVLFLPLMIFRQIAGLFRMGSRKVGGKKQARAIAKGPTKASLTVRGYEDLGEPLTAVRPERDEGARAGFAPGTVWSGTEIGIPLTNPSDRPYWYRVTVTDLARTEYEIHSPDFGVVDPDGLNRLDPGQATEFSVFIGGDGSDEQGEPRVFYVYVTQFARESEDAQRDIVQRRRYQWVPAPTARDMSLKVRPDAVMLRPWREQVELEVEFTNRSYFPCAPNLVLVRQDLNGEPLEEEPTVVEVPEPVPPHHRERWACVLEGGSKPGDPFLVQASATAVVAGAEEQFGQLEDIKPEAPVAVEWVPFLGVWKDWLILLVMLLALVWLVWGIPVRCTPVVHSSLRFGGALEGQLPPGLDPKQLQVNIEQWNPRAEKYKDNKFPMKPADAANEPAHFSMEWRPQWLGFWWVWPGGRVVWNPFFSRKTAKFRYRVTVEAEDLEPDYDVPKSGEGRFELAERRLFRAWRSDLDLEVPYREGVALDISFELGVAKGADKLEGEVTFMADREPMRLPLPAIPIKEQRAQPVRISLSDKAVDQVTIEVEAPGEIVSASKSLGRLEPQIEPYAVTVSFTDKAVAKLSLPAPNPLPVPFTFAIYDAEKGDVVQSGSSGGEAQVVSVEMTEAEQEFRVEIQARDCEEVPSRVVTLTIGKKADYGPWNVYPLVPPGSGGEQPSGSGSGEDEGWIPAVPLSAD